MKKQQKFNQQNSKLILEELEERRLFSGGVEGLITTGLDSDEQAIYADLDTNKAATDSTNEETSASAAEQQSHEVVFVDAGVDNYQQLVNDLLSNADSDRNIEVVVLDRNKDGIEEISELLSSRDDLNAVHIISHGDDGSIELGNTSLNAYTLEENNLSIALWANSFAETGDILIYGCNLAETEAGQSLINDLSNLTLADVAASTDLTGHASLGGDWALEFSVGQIESSIAVSAELQQEYKGTFATYTVTSLADSGAGSLRDAIAQANSSGGADTIEFSVAGTINLDSALPDITDQVTIDGSTAPGYDGSAPLITLDGTNTSGDNGLSFIAGSDGSEVRGLAIVDFDGVGILLTASNGHTVAGNYIGTDGTSTQGNGSWGIEITNSANNTIGGNTANDRNVIADNGSNINVGGITLWGASTTGNQITGNYIGTNAAGTAALGNAFDGISISGGANGNTIGGDQTAGYGNVISGNGNDGIEIDNPGADNNKVYGNFIGTDYTGNNDLGNTRHGVVLYNQVQGNEIGGTGTGEGNVISGNNAWGVIIDGAGNASTSGNTIVANIIGLDVDGDTRVENTSGGIQFFGSASNNTIGGTAAGAGNLISGNHGAGIYVTGSGTDANVIQGNSLGTDVGGITSIHNWSNNIDINQGATNTVVGGAAAGAGNVIAFSGNDGITIWSSSTTGTIVQGNFIGTDRSGTLNLGNSNDGVIISGGSTNNLIGGTGAGEGNLIAFNGNRGIETKDNGSGNQLVGNTVTQNEASGIHSFASGTDIIGNVVYSNNTAGTDDEVAVGDNNTLYHNTIHGSQDDGISVEGSSVVITNNIITGSAGYGINYASGSLTESYNLITDAVTGPANLGGQANFALSPTDINADPLFLDALNGDFRLTSPTSPGIDAGIDLGGAQPDVNGASPGLYDGAAPNMGTFESWVPIDANTAPNDLVVTGTSEGGLSLNEDGGNDAYLIADNGGAIMGGLTALTAEVRFSMDSFPNSTNFFSYATTGDDNVFKFNIRDDGDLSVSINSVKINSSAMDYRTLADGEQHTLSVTWDSSGGLWEMYVDGVLVDSGSGLESGVTLAGGGALVMGNDQDSVDGGYDPAAEVAATLFDARIFNDVRTSGEIFANYDQTVANTESGLLANWTFDDVSTEGVVTDTVSGNNLTVQHASGTGFVTSTPVLLLSVAENSANSTVVGNVSAIDPDAGDTFTYTLTDDAGGRFAINNSGQITVADGSLLDYETASSHNITVRVTDSGSNTFDKVFAIEVTDGNDTPSDIITDTESGTEAVVNAYTTGNQSIPAIAAFDDGRYIVVWESDGQDGSGDGIYAQIYNADGSVYLSEFQVNVETSDGEGNPSVATFADGGFVVTWRDVVAGSHAWTEARIFNADGTAATGDIILKTGVVDGTNEAYNPAVVALDNNRFVAVWNGENASVKELEGAIFDRSGTNLSGLLTLGTIQGNTGQWAGQPEIIALSGGGFAVSWFDDDNSGTNPRSWLRFFDTNGTPTSTEILLGGTGQTDLIELSNGNIAVVYDDGGTIRAQIVNSSGGSVVGEFLVNTSNGVNAEPTVTATSNGGFFVAWQNASGDADGSAIFGQEFDASGNIIASERVLNQTETGNQTLVELATLSDGSVRAAWSSTAQDGSGETVVVRQVATGGYVYENAANGTYVAMITDVIDADSGDTHSYSLIDNASGAFTIDANGIITVADNSLIDYESASSMNVTVRVTDSGGLTYDEAITINVLDVSETPVNSVPGAQSIAEDTTLTFSTANGNLISISDDVSDASHVVVSVSNGTLTVSGAGGATVTSDGTASVTLSGTVADINAALDGLQYTPTSDWSGSDTLTITTTDGDAYSLNIDANLLAWYEFSAGSGGADSSPAGTNNLTRYGDAVITNDPTRGDVLSLDGSGDYASVAGVLGEPANVTLSAWVNFTSVPVNGGEIISLGNDIAIRVNDWSEGVTGFFYDGSSHQYIGSGITMNAGEWHHVAFSFDDTNDIQTLYIDGQVAATGNFTSSISWTGWYPQTTIGTHSDLSDSSFDLQGMVDDARVYDRILSASEIETLANAPVPVSDTDTVTINVSASNDAPTFGLGDGIVTTDVGGNADGGSDIVLQPDGKIVVVGYGNNGTDDDIILTRYNPDGSLDVSFGAGGIATTAIGSGNDQGFGIALQPDGKIVVSGTSFNGTDDELVVLRYEADGSLDTSFGGGDGIVTTDLSAGDDVGNQIAVQSDGKIVVAGTMTGTDSDFGLVRYNADGTLDNTFGTTGVVTTDFGTGDDRGYSIALQADGKILVAGDSHNGSNNDFAIARYETNGALDATFGTGGTVRTGIAGNDSARDIVVQPDGNILVVGRSKAGLDRSIAIVRYDSDGALDATFGTGGVVITDIGSDDSAYGVALQADGKIVIAGETNLGGDRDVVIARYGADGTLDGTFGPNGKVKTDVAGLNDGANAVAIRSDGKIVVVGQSVTGANTDTLVIQYNTDGSVDTSFDSGILNSAPTFVENGTPVVLDSDVTVYDAELSTADNFDGATLTLVRNGGADADDVFSATGTLAALSEGGNLVVGGTTIGTVTTNSAGTLVLTFNANATNALVNSAMQQIAYSNSSDAPPASVQIDWSFDDGNSGAQGSGGAMQALGSTTVTIVAVDDPATVSGDVSYSGNEGDAVAGDMDATDVEGLTDGTYFTVSSGATNGTAAINATTGAWTFTPTDPNWFGSDSFTVTVTDDLGGTTNQIINITLANVDDSATITGDISFVGNEGDAVAGDLNATDVEGLTDGTYFTVSSGAANGTAAINATTGAWTFTPTDPNWFGSDSFTVTVTDDLGGTTNQVVSITLANVDDPGSITGDVSYSGNEGDAVAGDLNATDVDGLTDGTYFSVTTPASNGTAAINAATGAWTFTPTDPNWFGSDSFMVTVTDDLGGTTNQIINITLANIDDAAVITGDVSYVGNEGDAVAGDLNATDVEGLTDGTYFAISSGATNGTAAINATTGAWTFTPADPNWFGSDSFTVTVTDDLGGTTNQLISITLANVDDAAVITGDVSYVGNEGDAVSGDLNATDVDGLADGTYFTVSSAATHGTAAINSSTGAWTFTPTDPNWFGSDSFTVTVTDDLGGTTNQMVSITLANVDDAAVITGDVSFVGNEGDAVAGDLDATDVEGLTDGAYFTVSSAATNGTAAINATTGAWTFTPTDPNWFGSDSFTVTVTDDLGGTTNQIVNITLANVDDAAVITGDASFVGNEGDAVAGDLNATDVEGLTDGTYFTVSSGATNGTAAINATTGAWTFTPTDPNWFGSDSFTVTVTDDLGGTTNQLVSITLANVDDAAVITGDVSYVGNEGDAVAGDLNATDVEGLTDGTYFTVGSQATNGTAVINAATGAWTFTPTDPNWFGSDSFTVTVTDDLGGTTNQIVNITLANVDDAAVITGDISFVGNEGDAVAGDLNATDVEGLTDGTYFTVGSQATNGTAAINVATGAWTFTPTDPNWFGSDSFTVTVTDDLGGTTNQIVSITLAPQNDPSIITGDISFSGNEGDVVAGDLNATDVEGLTDGTYFTVSSGATHGTAAINTTTGAWTFTPTDPNWFGSDSFTVTVTDDLGGTTNQIVNITLANVDDAAVITGDVGFVGNEGDVVAGDLNATDVEGLTDGTYFTVSSGATNGTAAINATTGAWTFTPTDPNWFGSDSFIVTVTDDLGGTTNQLVSVTLANVDDAAIITGDVSFVGNEGDIVAGDLNATDVEGLTDGTYFSVSAPPSNGTAAINATTGAWTFTPTDPNWFGSDSFTVTVTDDLGGTTNQVVNITLANVDDAAVITGDISFVGNEGDAVAGDLNATDLEGLTDGTYFTVSSGATNGTAAINATTGAWTFTPTDPNWFGSDSFTVTVTDDLGGTTNQLVSITLANVDDPATITGDISFSGNEGDVVAGDLNATDVEGLTDGTYFTVSSGATNGTAAINATTGAWTFTPTDPNWFGSDSFTVTVTDDLGGTTNQVVSITLANVDDTAVITGDVSFVGNEGDAVSGDLNATDVEGLTDGIYFSISTAATNGNAAINATTGVWTFTPTDPNWFGSDSFTVTVTDDLGGTTNQIVNITLANVDDAAVITGDISFVGNEGDAVAGDLNATDVEGLTDGTYFTVSSGATNGTAAINATTGAWTFTPTDPNWFGSDSFTVTVTDDLGGTTNQIVNITLANVDDAAVITGDVSFVGNEGDVVAGDLNATDVEGLSDGTYFTVSSGATNGTAAINVTTGAWTFTPTDPNWFGSDSFTVTVTDDLGGTTNQIVSITLANVDDAAVITGDFSFVGNEGDAVLGDLNATDVEGLTDGTYFTVSSGATNGTAAINTTTGAWTFTPTDPNWFGTDSFTVTVTDDLGGTTNQLVSITLANVDDAAVITGDVSFSGNEGDAVAGDLNASDVEGLTDGTYFTISSGATNGTAAINATTGAWTFTPTDPNWFGSDSFTVTVTDDLGGTTNQVVNVILASVNDTAIIGGIDTGSVQEDVAVVANNISTGGVLTITDPDTGESTFLAATINGTYGDLTIDTAGNWTYTADNTQATIQQLDVTEFITDTLTVTSFDGTTHNVVITINGSEDAAVISGTTTGSVTEDGTLTTSGLLTISDTDTSDSPSFADLVVTPGDNNYGTFEMTAGTWTYTLDNSNPAVQALDVGETLSDTYTFTATDGGMQLVTVTINGAEDTPVFDSTAVTAATEGVAYSYTITTSDVDVESVTITAPTLPGWLTFVDNGDGTATLSGTPTNAEVGSHNVMLNVSDGTLSSNQNFTITVANANNAPVIGGIDIGVVTEDRVDSTGNLTVAGALTIADPDTGESNFVAQTIQGSVGAMTIDASGNWSYSADNSHAEIQALQAGESMTETLTVTTADGSTHDVEIIINGTAEAPPEPSPPEEPPPEDEPPEDEPPEETEEEQGGSGDDQILDEIVRVPQDIRSPDPEPDSGFAQANDSDSEPVNYPVIDKQPAKLPEQPQVQALKAQNLSIDTLTLQVSDDEALNEQYELELLERIDSMHLGMDFEAAQQNADDVEVQIFVGSTAGLTVGIVSWVLRGGALLASLMSTVPLLNRFDPLPILKSREDEKDVEPDDDEDERTRIREHARKVDNMFSEDGDQQQ